LITHAHGGRHALWLLIAVELSGCLAFFILLHGFAR
jgi:hypothetical protein